jgi:formylglycine-generating enzyme
MKFAFAFLSVLYCAQSALSVTIETVPIGNPNNLADTNRLGDAIGAVPYSFRIGKFEVSNAQYAEFLNAVAASDTFALFDPQMSSDPLGGITRSGVSGSYSYSTKTDMANRPANFVDWFDAIRFANWMHNGQGAPGTTEYGAYTFDGSIAHYTRTTIVRNPGARWWIPSHDEWYKAAYFDPDSASYFTFPTRSNVEPVEELPPGGINSANYGGTSQLTGVGSYAFSFSPYDTFDQGGNVDEWIDTLSQLLPGRIGGSINTSHIPLSKSFVWYYVPGEGEVSTGFRLATIPEPPSALLIIAAFSMHLRRRL